MYVTQSPAAYRR